MISVVNGYVCTSSCEAASAKQGKDPSAPPGAAQGSSEPKKTPSFASQPATVLSGALKDAANVVAAASNSTPSSGSQASVNFLA